MQGFAADPVYVKGEAFAYVGSIQNLKDLKDIATLYLFYTSLCTGEWGEGFDQTSDSAPFGGGSAPSLLPTWSRNSARGFWRSAVWQRQ
jgi:hypothetical protein